MKKLLFIFAGFLLIAAGIFLVRPSAQNASADHDDSSDNCTHSCPVIHFEWDTQEVDVAAHYMYADKEQVVDVAGHYTCPGGQHLGTGSNSTKCYQNGNNSFKGNAQWHDTTYKDVCPTGYSDNPGHSNCRLWVDDTYKTAHHSADVAYNKSSDPTKCHRPSDSDMENTYGMDHDAVQDFKNAHAEWLNSTKSAPDGYYVGQDNECHAKTPACADHDATNYGGVDGVFDSATEVANNDLCHYGNEETDVCPNIDGVQTSIPDGYTKNNDGQCVIASISITPTDGPTPTDVTPTVTPTSGGSSSGGDTHGDGLSDGRSSCPECTQAPSGNIQAVLGASTFAGTGTFEQNIMNFMLLAGIVVLGAGVLSYAKEKNK